MTLEPTARLNFTKELLAGIRVPSPPPKDFNPLNASNDTLAKHGLPLPPDEATYPQHYAKWVHLMSHARTFVSPEFEIIEYVPAPEALENKGGKMGGRRWAGAVITNEENDDAFRKVEGSWIVPRAYPLTDAWTVWGWENRSYRSGTWVGID